MIPGLEHVHFVALAYLAAVIVIVFLVLQSLFAAAHTARALEDMEQSKNERKDAAP